MTQDQGGEPSDEGSVLENDGVSEEELSPLRNSQSKF